LAPDGHLGEQGWCGLDEAGSTGVSSLERRRRAKYDFDALAVECGHGGLRPSIMTFGGDRERFVPPFPIVPLDNEVWRMSPPVGP